MWISGPGEGSERFLSFWEDFLGRRASEMRSVRESLRGGEEEVDDDIVGVRLSEVSVEF